MPSPSGTRASGGCWCLAADSSFNACDPTRALSSARLGAWNAEQPRTPSTTSRRRLSLPFARTVKFFSFLRFAAVSWASFLSADSRYWVTTLSLGSMSTWPKSRVVKQGFPSTAVPSGGTGTAWVAANHSLALQNATWPNSELPRPFTQLPVARPGPVSVIESAFDPNQSPTTAFLGSFGFFGMMAGFVPSLINSGL